MSKKARKIRRGRWTKGGRARGLPGPRSFARSLLALPVALLAPSRPCSTAVQADLDVPGPKGVVDLLRPQRVAGAVRQPLGHVLQAAVRLYRRALALPLGQPPQQAALLHQLPQQVGYLRQVVVGRPL